MQCSAALALCCHTICTTSRRCRRRSDNTALQYTLSLELILVLSSAPLWCCVRCVNLECRSTTSPLGARILPSELISAQQGAQPSPPPPPRRRRALAAAAAAPPLIITRLHFNRATTLTLTGRPLVAFASVPLQSSTFRSVPLHSVAHTAEQLAISRTLPLRTTTQVCSALDSAAQLSSAADRPTLRAIEAKRAEDSKACSCSGRPIGHRTAACTARATPV